MPSVNITFDDPPWPDLQHRTLGGDLHHTNKPIGVSGIQGGMTSGRPSVCIRVDLENGDVVIAETSLALLLTAADALKAKYGDPR